MTEQPRESEFESLLEEYPVRLRNFEGPLDLLLFETDGLSFVPHYAAVLGMTTEPIERGTRTTLLKATSLVSLITLSDLAFRAQTLNQATFQTVPIFTLVLLIYLVLSLVLTIGMRFLEDRAGTGLARGRAR